MITFRITKHIIFGTLMLSVCVSACAYERYDPHAIARQKAEAAANGNFGGNSSRNQITPSSCGEGMSMRERMERCGGAVKGKGDRNAASASSGSEYFKGCMRILNSGKLEKVPTDPDNLPLMEKLRTKCDKLQGEERQVFLEDWHARYDALKRRGAR